MNKRSLPLFAFFPMETTKNEVQLLFDLQMHVKENSVNIQRNAAEVKRLLESFENQIFDYLRSLFISANCIFRLLTKDFLLIPKDKLVVNGKFPFTEMNKKDNIETVMETIKNEKNILSICPSDPNETPLSYESYLAISALYHYLWSKEDMDAFSDLLSKIKDPFNKILARIFLVSPHTQIYFQSVLRPIFEKIESESEDSIHEEIISNLKLFAPIFPIQIRKFLNSTENSTSIFWDAFLSPFFIHSTVFGLNNPDLVYIARDKITKVAKRMQEFFISDESKSLMEEILNETQDLTHIPSSSLIKQVDQNYIESTIFDQESFKKLPVDVKWIPKDPIFHLHGEKRNHPLRLATYKENTLNNIIRRFLLKSKLVRVEVKPQTVLGYFDYISKQSSCDGDPDLVDELELLGTELENQNITSISELIEKFEDELSKEEANSNQSLLAGVSEYSVQHAYINKLKEISDRILQNTLNLIEFGEIVEMIDKLIVTSPIIIRPSLPEMIKNPKSFIEFYNNLVKEVHVENISRNPSFGYRNVCLVILHRLRILDVFYEKEDLKTIDQKMYDFVHDQSQMLLNYHQLSFLDIYKTDPTKLDMFIHEFTNAFKTKQPFDRISHIHTAYQILSGLLTIQDIGEIGADQIVPFAMLATVYSNPQGLASTKEFLQNYITPLLSSTSPLDHAEEYSLIQFCSTYQFLHERMIEATGENLDQYLNPENVPEIAKELQLEEDVFKLVDLSETSTEK